MTHNDGDGDGFAWFLLAGIALFFFLLIAGTLDPLLHSAFSTGP